jgi:hypothetical protein
VSKARDQEPDALAGAASSEVTFETFDPISIAPRGHVNLAIDGGLALTGDFDAGDVIPVTLTFGDGSEATLNVPVVRACNEYVGLDITEDSANFPYECDEEPEESGHGGA